MWNCVCFQKCLDKQFSQIIKKNSNPPQNSNNFFCSSTELHEIKCKLRSVCRAPRLNNNNNKQIVNEMNSSQIGMRNTTSKNICSHSNSPPPKKKSKANKIYKDQFKCLFCGGKKCQYENYLNNNNHAIIGLHCDLIEGVIYLGQRPSNYLIRKYHLLQTFKNNNIGLIVNLQRQGEHPYCGPGEMDDTSGFMYSPEIFSSEGIRVKLAGWREMTAPDAWDFILDVVKEIYYMVIYKKKKVYIHCHTGNSRSGIVMACYKMYTDKCTAYDAISLIKSKRPKALNKKDHIKYCQRFEEYLISLREIFTRERYDLRIFLKRQWDLDVFEKTLSYIPILIQKCISKILSLKYSENRVYDNNTIYKAMNGSLGLIDEVYIQIRTLMKQINLGQWEELDKCESVVILSELLFYWMDESVNACINPKRIEKIVGSNLFNQNINNILTGKCNKLNIITNIFSFCKKNLKTAEFEILKFFSVFFEKVYPYNPSIQPSAISRQNSFKNTNNFFHYSRKESIEKIESTDDIEEYRRMLEKIAIFLTGFNIDILYNQDMYLTNLQNNLNGSYCDATLNSHFINKESITHVCSKNTHCTNEDKGIRKLIDDTIKILEFFRIYLKISKASILQMTLTKKQRNKNNMLDSKDDNSKKYAMSLGGDHKKMKLALMNNNDLKDNSVYEEEHSLDGISFWDLHNMSYSYDSNSYVDSSSADDSEEDKFKDENTNRNNIIMIKQKKINGSKLNSNNNILRISDEDKEIVFRSNSGQKSSKLNTVVCINNNKMNNIIIHQDEGNKRGFSKEELKLFNRKAMNTSSAKKATRIESPELSKDNRIEKKEFLLNKMKNNNFILKYCWNKNTGDNVSHISNVDVESSMITPTFVIPFKG